MSVVCVFAAGVGVSGVCVCVCCRSWCQWCVCLLQVLVSVVYVFAAGLSVSGVCVCVFAAGVVVSGVCFFAAGVGVSGVCVCCRCWCQYGVHPDSSSCRLLLRETSCSC